MRTKIAIAAASVGLILSAAAGALAGEPEFRTPATDRAQQTQSLLTQAAHAVYAGAARTGEGRISKLWVFPTADENTVFAQYIVTTKQPSSKDAAAEEHLDVLKLKDGRIVEQRDLVHATR